VTVSQSDAVCHVRVYVKKLHICFITMSREFSATCSHTHDWRTQPVQRDDWGMLHNIKAHCWGHGQTYRQTIGGFSVI